MPLAKHNIAALSTFFVFFSIIVQATFAPCAYTGWWCVMVLLLFFFFVYDSAM